VVKIFCSKDKFVKIGNSPLLGKQRALSLDIWPVPNIDSAIGYFRVETIVVVACEYAVFQLGLTLVRPKVESNINRDFAAQCSMFTLSLQIQTIV